MLDPISLSLGGLSTLAGLGSTIYGYKKLSEENENQNKLLLERKNRADDYFNRNYYQDYFNTAEAQNAMRRVEESLRNRGKVARGRQAVMGGTTESVLAQQENDQKALTDTASNLAEQSTALKRNADNQHQAALNTISDKEMGLSAQREAGYAQLAQNGANMMSRGLLSMANGYKWDSGFGDADTTEDKKK